MPGQTSIWKQLLAYGRFIMRSFSIVQPDYLEGHLIVRCILLHCRSAFILQASHLAFNHCAVRAKSLLIRNYFLPKSYSSRPGLSHSTYLHDVMHAVRKPEINQAYHHKFEFNYKLRLDLGAQLHWIQFFHCCN